MMPIKERKLIGKIGGINIESLNTENEEYKIIVSKDSVIIEAPMDWEVQYIGGTSVGSESKATVEIRNALNQKNIISISFSEEEQCLKIANEKF